jgi:hypothetical protein
MRSRRQLLALGCGIALAAACAAGPWTELDSMEDLKAAFQRDRGKTRIVLLLSPT